MNFVDGLPSRRVFSRIPQNKKQYPVDIGIEIDRE